MPPDTVLTAPVAGAVVAIAHAEREEVPAGAAVVALEAMRMEHEVVADGGFKAHLFTVARPTAEFGAMGLEGAVQPTGKRRPHVDAW